jgi:hypothetical protein
MGCSRSSWSLPPLRPVMVLVDSDEPNARALSPRTISLRFSYDGSTNGPIDRACIQRFNTKPLSRVSIYRTFVPHQGSRTELGHPASEQPLVSYSGNFLRSRHDLLRGLDKVDNFNQIHTPT